MNTRSRLAVALACATATSFASCALSPGAVADTPTTVPTQVQATGDSGAVTLSAVSDATLVRFSVDGIAVAVAPVGPDRTASASWESWGRRNGAYTLTAADCADPTACGTDSGPAGFTVANVAATIDSPQSGATVRGGFTVGAHFAGGQLRLLLDGKKLGTPTTASPYRYSYRGPALSTGNHTVSTQLCSTDGTLCQGPTSRTTFHADGLHPTLIGVQGSPFSPNGDGVRDSVRVLYRLPDSETARAVVRAASGTVVRAVRLGAQRAGTHDWSWNGRRGNGARAADGNYTVELATTKTINGVTVAGMTAHRRVTVDTSAPALRSVQGGGDTFYPYVDGYRDRFAPSVRLGGAGRLTLTVYSGRTAVRTITASRRAGRAALTWNGRDTHHRAVPAGTYRWRYTVRDSIGNTGSTRQYSVHVSTQRLIASSTVVTRNGAQRTKVTGDPACTQFSTGLSQFDHGIWLDNVCDPDYDGFDLLAAHYSFAVPGAVRYGRVSVRAYGSTLYPPSSIFAYFFAPGPGTNGAARVGKARGANQWYSLGSVDANGYVSASHTMHVAIGVDDSYNSGGNSSDFDMRNVEFRLTYFRLGPAGARTSYAASDRTVRVSDSRPGTVASSGADAAVRRALATSRTLAENHSVHDGTTGRVAVRS